MSLITRCPACQTFFKVVPDQLRISEGWVRCGQCNEIFDASLHMLSSTASMSAPSVGHADLALMQNSLPGVADDAGAAAISLDAMESHGSLVDVSPEPAELAAMPQPAEGVLVVPLEQDEVTSGPTDPDELPSLTRKANEEPEPESRSDAGEVSFLRERGRAVAKSSLFSRAIFVSLSLLLAVGLAGQIVVHERDRIATLQPGMKPWLQALCDPLNCKISPWRHIEAIVIDSSAFTRIRDDSYRLTLTLKNTANVPLALPALELTLTSSLDQPVVRRIFVLSQLESASDTMAAGLEWPMTLAMSVNPDNGSERIAGYRLLAFYP